MSSTFETELLPLIPAVASFARQLCHDKDLASDLTQETMIKAFVCADMYAQGSNSRAWLFQICKNSFINQYRRKQRQPAMVEFHEDPDLSGSQRDRASREEIGEESASRHSGLPWIATLGDEVAEALELIPPDYQTAIVLCDIEEFSYAEIAALMNVPVGTIRSRIHRGRKMLARRLAGYARGHGFSCPAQD